MGSGEADVAHLKVTKATPVNSITVDTNTYYDNYLNPTTTVGWNNTSWYGGPTHIYLYQVRCPKRVCKTYNWLELDKISPCTKCGARLKAVADEPDFTIPVHK